MSCNKHQSTQFTRAAAESHFVNPSTYLRTLPYCGGFSGDSDEWGDSFIYQYRHSSLILGSGRSPGVGNGNSLQYFAWEILWTERILVGYGPLLFSCSVVSDSLWLHGLQHARLLCPSLSPRTCSNSCPLSRWCHPTISFSVIPFSSCPQSFPASGSFQMSQLFESGGQSIGASASTSVLPLEPWYYINLFSKCNYLGSFPCQ